MKKWSKKLLGIMLSVSMTMAAVFPVQSVAAESNGGGYEDVNQEQPSEEEKQPSKEEPEEDKQSPEEKEEPEEETTSETQKEEKQPSKEEIEEEKDKENEILTSEEENQQPKEEETAEAKEESEAEEENRQLWEEKEKTEEETTSETQEEESKQPIEEEKQTTEEEKQPPAEAAEEQPQADITPAGEPSGGETETSDREKQKMVKPQEGESENPLSMEGSYDINQPVIEGFEFVENGQVLTKEDTVHFNMYVYDADSDIKSISVKLYGNHDLKTLHFVKGSEENLYTAVLSCDELSFGQYRVDSIRVEDLKNNYVDGNVYGDHGEYLYQFTIENKVTRGTVTLSGIQLKKNSSNEDGTLKAGDSVTFTADVQCDGEEISSADMRVDFPGGYREWKRFNAEYDAESGTISGTFNIGEKTYPAEWELTEIQVWSKAGNYFCFSIKEIAPDADLKFTVAQEYDEEKPIIESIDIGENGRTVQAGETVDIKVKVKEEHIYDWGRIDFNLREEGASGQETVTLRYDESAQEYTGSIQVTSQTHPGKWEISYLSIKDTFSNYAYLRDFQEDGTQASRYYIVAPEGYDDDKPVIKSISLENNDKALRAGATVTVKVEVEEENPSNDQAYARFEPQSNAPYMYSEGVTLRYNASARAYIGEIKITESTCPGQWNLTYMHLYDKNDNVTYLSDYEETDLGGPWHYTVAPDDYDVDGPEIESITLDKNEQWVRPGDIVNIRIKVKEKNPSSSGTLYFQPQAAYVSASMCVDVTYNPSTKEYTGALQITEDTYPCEWALTDIDLKDQMGYWPHMTDELSGWSYTYPWYFRVKSGNTYREDVKDVEFTFYGFSQQEDGSYALGYTYKTLENVGKRASLKELGVFPQPIQGVTTVWRYSGSGSEVKEDTKLPFYSTDKMYCYLYASYDKGCANVSLTYMSKNDGKKTVMIPQFVERDATYQDVLNALKMPEDAVSEDFAELRLSYSNDSHNKNTKVGDVARISVEADYKTCQATWNARYMGQDGKEASKVISQSCFEGTTVGEALAKLEKPEDVLGMQGTGWALIGADENEVMSKEMVSYDVVALYQGKTTLDVSYIYRGEDGKIANGTKMMILNGENLSDAQIQGEATGAFKNVEHLAGMRLSEWKSVVDVNQEKYKKIHFQAYYHNCVVVLKYPDETCQYLVVDRNASFTLPTENETYKDIIWEGFEMGQSVIITEDREFLAASAVLWDGTKEDITGERLPDSEIEKIKEQIEQAGPGDSIVIDMKKATVVPKEVLEAMKGKSVDVVLNMGAYSWSIAGTDVNATDLKDIDLEVTIGTNTVPSGLVESIAEGQPATQLSLTHNGEFGFRADLTLNLGGEHSGSTGNLYYYDSSGKLIFRTAGQIGADGTVSLSFSHASDYVVVIAKGEAPDEDPDDKTEDTTDETEEETTDKPEKTDDNQGDEEDNDFDQEDKEDDEKIGDNDNTEDTREDEPGDTVPKVEPGSGETKPSSTVSSKLKSPKTGE